MNLFKFILVGLLGFALNIGITYFFKEYFALWYFWAYLLSVWFTWTFLFLGNSIFTFKGHSKENYFQKYIKFLSGYSVMFFVNGALVYLFTSIFSIYYILSIFFATVITTFITFAFSKKFVYKD
jgi:putative flippase GtrA